MSDIKEGTMTISNALLGIGRTKDEMEKLEKDGLRFTPNDRDLLEKHGLDERKLVREGVLASEEANNIARNILKNFEVLKQVRALLDAIREKNEKIGTVRYGAGGRGAKADTEIAEISNTQAALVNDFIKGTKTFPPSPNWKKITDKNNNQRKK